MPAEFTVFVPDKGEPPYVCKSRPDDVWYRIADNCCGLVPWGMFYFSGAEPSGPQSGTSSGCSGCFMSNSLRCGKVPTSDEPAYLYAGGAEFKFSFYLMAVDNISTNPECSFCVSPTCTVHFTILFPNNRGEYWGPDGRPINPVRYTVSATYDGGISKDHSGNGCDQLGLGMTIKLIVNRGDPRQGFVPELSASKGGTALPIRSDI